VRTDACSVSFFGCSALSSGAQGRWHARVEGVVRDSSGAFVGDAEVKLTAASYSAGATTGPAGAFSFVDVPAASGTIAIAAKGFRPTELAWKAWLTGGEAGIDVRALAERLEFRGTFFLNEVMEPVSNVPCTSATPNCPPVEFPRR